MRTTSNDKSDYYNTLLIYKDYTFLMHLACYNTSSFYFYVKVALNFINILMSSSVSMLNSSQVNVAFLNDLNDRSFHIMMIAVKASVVINFVICLSSGILYYFQIAEKELFFKIHADNYLKLNNVILSEISTAKQIEQSFVKFILQEFIFLIENMHFAIPSFVKRNIKRNYYHYNMPPYLDIYMNHFTIMTKIMNIKNWLKRLPSTPMSEHKSQYIMSASNVQSPKMFQSISPILKNYSYDSYDIVLSKSVYYNTSNNDKESSDAADISPIYKTSIDIVDD